MNSNQKTYLTSQNAKKWEGLSSKRVAVIITQWNSEIIDGLLWGAKQVLDFAKVKHNVVIAPGAYELAYYAKRLLSKKEYDGAVTLGCVLKGETIHFEMISLSASINIAQVGISLNKPVSFGVLTSNKLSQALDRSKKDNYNKGMEATAALLDIMTSENNEFR